MADETLSAVNINDLPKIEEIKSGNYILIENADGTGIIDYKNFIVGTDNITFATVLSTQDATIKSLSSTLNALSTLVASKSASSASGNWPNT